MADTDLSNICIHHNSHAQRIIRNEMEIQNLWKEVDKVRTMFIALLSTSIMTLIGVAVTLFIALVK